jgi:hypothetical protein
MKIVWTDDCMAVSKAIQEMAEPRVLQRGAPVTDVL